jgi:hypothetical protein
MSSCMRIMLSKALSHAEAGSGQEMTPTLDIPPKDYSQAHYLRRETAASWGLRRDPLIAPNGALS